MSGRAQAARGATGVRLECVSEKVGVLWDWLRIQVTDERVMAVWVMSVVESDPRASPPKYLNAYPYGQQSVARIVTFVPLETT